MKVGEASFPLHTIDLNNAKVLIRPEQAERAKGKNVIIGEEMPKNVNDKIPVKEVVLEKTPDGKESLKITLKASRPGGQASSLQNLSWPVTQVRPVRLASSTGQTQGRPKIFKPKRSEVGTWNVNESKVQGGVVKQKLTFDQLLNKYTKAIPKDWTLKIRSRSSLRQGKRSSPRRESSKRRSDSTTVFPPQKVYATTSWAPSASGFSYPTWKHEGIWMYCYPMLHPPSQ